MNDVILSSGITVVVPDADTAHIVQQADLQGIPLDKIFADVDLSDNGTQMEVDDFMGHLSPDGHIMTDGFNLPILNSDMVPGDSFLHNIFG